MVFEEKTISSEMIYEGAVLNLRKDRVHVRDGQVSYREIVEHNGGVAVATVTSAGEMVLVKQYRKAAEKFVLEVPAGKLERHEKDPLLAAKRELKEETGYDAQNMELLTTFYSSIGYSTELLSLYLATDLTPGDTCFDETEAIEVYHYPIDQLHEMIQSGEIIDAKTIVAITLTGLRLAQEKTPKDSPAL